LYRLLVKGKIEEPMRNPENSYRIWTDVDVQAIRETLQK
jgi:hypothetical protein